MVKHTSFYRAINCAFYHSALAIISLVVFTVYVMTGHILTAERVFVVLGLLMAVRVCFTLFFSLGVMYLKESAVSEKRVQVKCHYHCIHIGYIYVHDVKNKNQKAQDRNCMKVNGIPPSPVLVVWYSTSLKFF